MSEDVSLRDAARRVLSEPSAAEPRPGRARTTDRLSLPPDAPTEVRVGRVAIDVQTAHGVETVTLVLRDGELAWTSTDGTAGREGLPGTPSPSVRAALRWLAAGPGPMSVGRPSVDVVEARRGFGAGVELQDPARRVGGALSDLALALFRAGSSGRESPSVRDAVDRVARAIAPTPVGLSRFLGRVERALANDDVRTLSLLMDGALRASEAMNGTLETAASMASFLLGGTEAKARIVDRPFVEVGRENLDGVQRAAIERRYLLDLGTGEVLAEERSRSDLETSLGPCPRSLFVGLGEAFEGSAPRRIRVLQYTVSLDLTRADYEQIRSLAWTGVGELVARHREAVVKWPATAEPVALVACRVDGGRLVDLEGTPLPFSEHDDGASAALRDLVNDHPPIWVFGRTVEVDGGIRLAPCSVGFEHRIERLR